MQFRRPRIERASMFEQLLRVAVISLKCFCNAKIDHRGKKSTSNGEDAPKVGGGVLPEAERSQAASVQIARIDVARIRREQFLAGARRRLRLTASESRARTLQFNLRVCHSSSPSVCPLCSDRVLAYSSGSFSGP